MKERSASALHALQDRYDIRGEVRGDGTIRRYLATTRGASQGTGQGKSGGGREGDHASEVAIVVVSGGEGSPTNDLTHFAADAQILAAGAHPAIPRVLDSMWLDQNTVAVVSEPVIGETLHELLERGERFPKPRIAMALQEVSAVLDWARENGVVHRGVTPESLTFERDSHRVRVSLVPTPVPMTGVPDAAADARTIAWLAWAFITGAPHDPQDPRSIGEVDPNLAQRVVEETDTVLHGDGPPDVATFLGVLSAGDVLKRAEVELLAQKEEYEEAHRREIADCEARRQEAEDNAARQIEQLAHERAEFEQAMFEERAALDTERQEFQASMTEQQSRYAGLRAKLDEQRDHLEQRIAEIAQYRTDVEQVRDDALAAREEAKAARAQAQTAREQAKAAVAKAQEAAAAHAAAVKEAQDACAVPVPSPTEDEQIIIPDLPSVGDEKLPTPPRVPKWDKIRPLDLAREDEEMLTAASDNGRPRWLVPSGIVTLLLVLAAAVLGSLQRQGKLPREIHVGNSVITVPQAPALDLGFMPRGGFLTQSAGGNVAPVIAKPKPDTAAAKAAQDTTALSPAPAMGFDPAHPTQAQLDSIDAANAAAAERRAARQRAERAREAAIAEEAAREAERLRQQQITDSLNSPASSWNMPPVDTIGRDSTFRRDSTTRRPDSSSSRPDTTRPRPDTSGAPP